MAKVKVNNMDDFRIAIADNDIFIDNSLSAIIDTPFYVQINNFCFPDCLWTDFSYPVICVWAENLLRNRGRINTHYTLPFMDGPYWIDVTQNGNNLLLKGINERKDKKIEFISSCTVASVLHELLRAINKSERIVLDNEKLIERETRESILNSIHHYKMRIREDGDRPLCSNKTPK